MKISIGTRKSKLAIYQSEWVRDRILEKYPDYNIQIVSLDSEGDRRLDQSLAEIGGKGLFTQELEQALREKRIDLAVHSLKDMPQPEKKDLPIRALTKRENPLDALIVKDQSKRIQTIGTSSLRRMRQLQGMYPDAGFVTLRGNIQTRLDKLDRGDCDATILAVAGLNRLSLRERINHTFTPSEMVPAAGQGILAVQGRADDAYDYLSVVNDLESCDAYEAEKAFIIELNANCTSAVGAYAEIEDQKLIFYGMMTDHEGRVYRDIQHGARFDAAKIGQQTAQKLLKQTRDKR